MIVIPNEVRDLPLLARWKGCRSLAPLGMASPKKIPVNSASSAVKDLDVFRRPARADVGMGRAASDLRAGRIEINAKVNGGGQECPPYTYAHISLGVPGPWRSSLGSFDSAGTSLREVPAPLRMTLLLWVSVLLRTENRELITESVLRRRLRLASTTIFRRRVALFAKGVEGCSSPRTCLRGPDAVFQTCRRRWPGTSLRRRG